VGYFTRFGITLIQGASLTIIHVHEDVVAGIVRDITIICGALVFVIAIDRHSDQAAHRRNTDLEAVTEFAIAAFERLAGGTALVFIAPFSAVTEIFVVAVDGRSRATAVGCTLILFCAFVIVIAWGARFDGIGAQAGLGIASARVMALTLSGADNGSTRASAGTVALVLLCALERIIAGLV
jgi:hypothetical protein